MAYFSKADTETRIVGGSERHEADTQNLSLSLYFRHDTGTNTS